jgi:hypothetical protein
MSIFVNQMTSSLRNSMFSFFFNAYDDSRMLPLLMNVVFCMYVSEFYNKGPDFDDLKIL